SAGPLFAESPYGAFPTGYHPGFKKAYGPYYLVPLGSGDITQVVVAVSAYATDVSITVEGWIDFPSHHGNEFISRAVPAGATGYQIRSPESAAIEAAVATGALVAAAPQLVLLGRPYSPLQAAWRVTLDRPVTGRSLVGAEVTTREIYVSHDSELGMLSARRHQPDHQTVGAVPRILPAGRPPDGVIINLPVRHGFDIDLQQVSGSFNERS
ncbi:MAG: hypothetical protein ACREQV_00150, partial [Candidatus Binatia bacterium]